MLKKGMKPEPMTSESKSPLSGDNDEQVIEDAVASYLDQCADGKQVEVSEFLDGCPEKFRSAIGSRISASLETLAILGGAADSHQEAPPSIPGFTIEHVIGKGALGTVYRGIDETLHRPVAIKVLRRGTATGRRRRIIEEGRRVAALSDRAIVTIHSVVEEGDLSAIVMELVEGHAIDRAAAPLQVSQKVDLLIDLARALSAAHSRGIIHRDLKPQNILVTPELGVRILDFGLAISSEENPSREIFEGTPLYASPEQISAGVLTTASDIFSFGSLMFRLLTGTAPFDGESIAEIFEGITRSVPPFLRGIDSQIDTDLQAICLACLAKDPLDRPSAKEIHEDLLRYRSGESVRLRPALYSDILKNNIARHDEELQEWSRQGLISSREKDHLDLVYRRILEEEDHWIADARSLTRKQILLYAGAWSGVVATVLLAFFTFKVEPGDLTRWLGPTLISVFLIVAGEIARRNNDRMVAATFFSSAVLALVPTTIALLRSFGWLAVAPPEVEQLFRLYGVDDVTNQQLLTATFGSLLLSLFALTRLKMAAFAWTTTVLVALVYFALLLNSDYLGWENQGWQAIAFLPLVVLLWPGLHFENTGRVRWALPFHMLVLLVAVFSLDALAAVGGPLELVEPVTDRHLTYFAFAINGVVFIALMWLCEKSGSLDLRRGAKLLELIAPFHFLGGLLYYANDVAQIIDQPAEGQWVAYGLDFDGWYAVGLYLTGVAATLLLASWGWRSRFLFGGLMGIIAGSLLLLNKTLLPQLWVVIFFATLGMLVAILAYRVIRVDASPEVTLGENDSD